MNFWAKCAPITDNVKNIEGQTNFNYPTKICNDTFDFTGLCHHEKCFKTIMMNINGFGR
jgi:hypothetical protein